MGIVTYFGIVDGRTVGDVLEANSGSSAMDPQFNPALVDLSGVPLGVLGLLGGHTADLIDHCHCRPHRVLAHLAVD